MSFSFRAGTLNLVESKGSGGGVVKRILKADSRKGLISVVCFMCLLILRILKVSYGPL